MKVCGKCNAEYETTRCVTCRKRNAAASYLRHREKRIAESKAWREVNPEQTKETLAAYRIANAAKIKESRARIYQENKDKESARRKARYAANSSKVKAARAEYRERNLEAINAYRAAHPELNRIYSHNRRARERGVGGRVSPGLADKLFKLQKGKCACCYEPLGDDYHLDHIMPIALGGANEDWNIQLLRAGCNLQKNCKHPVEFMQQRGFLI